MRIKFGLGFIWLHLWAIAVLLLFTAIACAELPQSTLPVEDPPAQVVEYAGKIREPIPYPQTYIVPVKLPARREVAPAIPFGPVTTVRYVAVPSTPLPVIYPAASTYILAPPATRGGISWGLEFRGPFGGGFGAGACVGPG